jgi:hypothetical protein
MEVKKGPKKKRRKKEENEKWEKNENDVLIFLTSHCFICCFLRIS